jgi:hypothetical protein
MPFFSVHRKNAGRKWMWRIQIVSFADPYAVKIVAALDRQHPGDLSDVRNLVAKEGVEEVFRKAFIIYPPQP